MPLLVRATHCYSTSARCTNTTSVDWQALVFHIQHPTEVSRLTSNQPVVNKRKKITANMQGITSTGSQSFTKQSVQASAFPSSSAGQGMSKVNTKSNFWLNDTDFNMKTGKLTGKWSYDLLPRDDHPASTGYGRYMCSRAGNRQNDPGWICESQTGH